MKPILTFDTSAINALADIPDLEPVELGLRTGFFVRQNETTIGEIVATGDSERRQKLLAICRRLVCAGDYLYPYHWITRELAAAHRRKSVSFNWRSVNVLFPAIERELALNEMFDDDLAKEQRAEAKLQKQNFIAIFSDARKAFDELFKEKPAEKPFDLGCPVDRLQEANGAFWRFGMSLYRHEEGDEPTEGTVREFTKACPPFRALLLAICVAQYQYSIKSQQDPQSYKAGKFGLFSAVYLPYCDKFVTADDGQCNALRAVVQIGDLTTEVIAFEDLLKALMILPSASG